MGVQAAMCKIWGVFDRTSGGGLSASSKLCQEIAREDLAFSCKPYSMSYSDVGLFGMYLTVDPYKLKDCSHIIQEEMVRLVFTVSGADVGRAKAALKTELLSKTTTEAKASTLAEQVIYLDRVVPVAELMARVDAITAGDIQRVAERLIWDQEVAVVAVGAKLKELPDLNQL